MADEDEPDSTRPAVDLLEVLGDLDPQLLSRHSIDRCAWRAFGLRLHYEGLVQNMPRVTSASRLIEAAKQLIFHNDGLGAKRYGYTANQMALLMEPTLRVQSTRAALAFVNMIPSLQSLNQLLNLAPRPTLDDYFADYELNREGLATINKTLWGLLFSVFEAYDDSTSTIEIAHLCRFINNMGINVAFIHRCVAKCDYLLREIYPRISMGFCHLCVDLIALRRGTLATEVTPVSADPPTFTGLLRAFQEDLDNMVQYAKDTVALDK
ncbi:hypothetical protein RB601_005870 [Gaeumannomyces tritici]